eukprot:jgi/Hompol1/4802/HPOL_001273-RA
MAHASRRMLSGAAADPVASVWQASEKVSHYANQSLNTVTLDYLLRLGRERDVRGCAAVVARELPIRLARRVRAIQKLPFIVGVNPWIKSVYELYRNSFERLSALPANPSSPEDLKLLRDTLAELTETHKAVIPSLAKGFMECGRYMDPRAAQQFLDGLIHARIGIRVIAEHYLALQEERDGWIGVVNTQASPKSIISATSSYVQQLCEYNYGAAPDVEFSGAQDTKFAYIPVHVEYIVMEVLKNAMRATVEYSKTCKRIEHPPIQIAIAQSPTDVTIRFRDEGGGVPIQHLSKIWNYSFTTVPKLEEEEGVFSVQSRIIMQNGVGGPMAGLGFGLPMSRIYAKYFGGALDLRTVHGHGTDVFVRFPNISQIESTMNI